MKTFAVLGKNWLRQGGNEGLSAAPFAASLQQGNAERHLPAAILLLTVRE
jgi:hypothetical protein